MATLTCLPEEVIRIILENRSISMEDIVNFKSTCKSLQQIPLHKKFWERKFYQRCPTAKKKYNTDKQKEIFNNVNFESRIKKETNCVKKLQYYMSSNYMSEDTLHITELEYFLRCIATKSLTYYFVLDELNKILSTQLPWQLGSDLPITYQVGRIFYSLKVYRFIYKQYEKYNDMPVRKQLLERLLTIVAQYFVPHVSYSVIKMWLDDIVQEVLSCLKKRYPTHSIFSTPLEQFLFWKNNNIYDNFWNETEARQIMYVLEEFIFSTLEIHKLYQLFVTTDREKDYTVFISQFLQKYLLSATYHCVARRLGIRCILVVKREHFARNPVGIAWSPKYNTTVSRTEFLYMNDESHLSYPSNIVREVKHCNLHCDLLNPRYRFSDRLKTDIMVLHFYRELKYNFEHSTVEYYKWNSDSLSFFLGPFISHILTIDGSDDIEFIDIEHRYDYINYSLRNRPYLMRRQSERRNTNINFAIGMIVSHSSDMYYFDGNIHPIERHSNHVGVIIGWHHKHKIECVQKYTDPLYSVYFNGLLHAYEWYMRHFQEFLDQPHYLILSENNGVCYIHQDALSMCQPKWINNVRIGKFFSRFEGTHYVPIDSLAEEYPSDAAVISEILSNQ